jgi:hypothetical protein
MAQFVFIAAGSAQPGHEEEYNSWYENEHLPAVLRVDGFVAATRYRSAPTSLSASPYGYVTIYEVEAESAELAHATLMDAAKSGALGSSAASDRERAGAWFFEPAGERRTS